MRSAREWAWLAILLACSSARAQSVPAIGGVFGPPVTFATHTQLAGYGFSYGPSDGEFGAIPAGGNTYIFYGDAGGSASCAGSPNTNGAFSFAGTLDQVTGGNGCKKLFGPGDGPAGWVFDRNYAGGGQVVRFASGGKSGWLMPFHGEYQWQNLANPPSYKCTAGAPTSLVPCFYGSLGLAVSTDNGKTFQVVGQIFQPSQPLSFFQGGGTNMAVGYGSLIVADANGKHLDNPPADPSAAYFYLFYSDLLPGLPGACATYACFGVARAPYADVIDAVFSGDPHQVATVFHKYDGASPNPWTQPATGDTPDLSGTAGKYAPLWTDEPVYTVEVIYDRSFDVYLAVYSAVEGVKVRASSDLIHWSGPIAASYSEPGRTLFYPTLVGETGDPTIAGPAPRVYFSSFPTGSFPNYTTAVFESVPLTLSVPPGSPSISLSNAQLGFYYVTGDALPAAQSIGIANSGGGTLSWSASANVPWIALSETANGFTVSVNPAGLAPGVHPATISVIAPDATNNPQTVSVALTVYSSVQVLPSSATRFVPITPCRIADTRKANGPLGGPTLPRQTSRDFAIPSSACGIPSTAVAYSLNVAVVPAGPLGYLTLWPTGQPQPLVATLNSIDGRVKSNAAIVPAGLSGAISLFVTDATDVVLDINGYFVPITNTGALAFYPVTPCRVADTRNAAGPLGGPSLAAQATRSFPISASSCGVPASAQAYSLNFAAVTASPLGYLTAWPAGQRQPLVASLNDPTGTVLSNAVVVPAGANGDVNVFTTDATDLVIDINGYFAPPGAGGLSLHTVAPCRVLDSRLPAGSPPFNATRDVNVTASPCGVPATAHAFVFNATAVPPGFLGYITMWPQGQSQPPTAVLNAYDGAVANNMAIVPTTTGSVSVFPSAPTHLVLDIFGYFAP